MDDRLQRYTALLLEWNRRVNLTAARSPDQVKAHLDDALALLALDWVGVREVVDVGSGGGLPGIPLAIRLPGVRLTLVEVSLRKAAFLEHVAGRLELTNVTVLAQRAEDLGHDQRFREKFDRAVSRAAARPAVVLELALPLIRSGGDLLASVGRLEPQSLSAAAARLGGGTPSLESLAGGTLVLRVPKLAPTPAAYPRRPGVANRRPLG
jgi:16S rRNA (guanine527-N7)-methyltransferase